MDFFRANKPTIAFLPLDLDYRLPDENEILAHCNEHFIQTHDTTETGPAWEITPICGRFNPNDWYQPIGQQRWFERYLPSNEPLQWAHDADNKFPEIKYMLDQLPYKQLSLAVIFNQQIPVTCHIDWFEEDLDNDRQEQSIENEPRRFNINLTKHHYKSFYVAPTEDGERSYCKITKEVPGYAITERYNWHGADYAGPDKLILVTAGLIDKEKRDILVYSSMKKYKENAIMFG